MKAGGVKFADTPEEAESLRARDPRAGDQRAHAARRARRPEGRGRAGVLRGRRLGRHPQAAGDDLLAGRRHRHRAGRRGAARQGRAPALLEHPAVQRLPGQGGDRLHRRHRLGAEQARADRHAPGEAVRRERHDRSPRSTRSGGSPTARSSRSTRTWTSRTRRAAATTQLLADLGVGEEETRQAREATPFELAGEAGRRAGPPRRRRQRDRVRRQPRPRDRRRRRLADAVRRRPRARRPARQLLRDRRQPLGRQGLRPGQAGAAASRASTRSR